MEFETRSFSEENSDENRADRFTDQYDELCKRIEDNPKLLENPEVARQMERLLTTLEGMGMDPVEEEPTFH